MKGQPVVQRDKQTEGLSRIRLGAFSSLALWVLSGTLVGTEKRELCLEAGKKMLVLNRSGALLAEDGPTSGRRLLNGGTGVLAQGGTHIGLLYARGSHEWLEVEWADESMPFLKSWPQSQGEGQRGYGLVTLVRHSLTGEIDSGCRSPLWLQSETNLWAVIYATLGMTDVSRPAKTSHPNGEPTDQIHVLLSEVRRHPERDWTLRTAAETVGYSQFHLSRKFRTMFDHGFPQYVERCRVDKAVRQLLTTNLLVDEIARCCGFGSPQGMREALRDVVGFLPSELRSPA
ncbi:MAG: helix-turn-helix transcriptional regulator [Fimbriimonadaceae bacterium]|nr:helix-turn-helix transcriptional regulator [Fimbriimonadaceae bacterium]QYK57222.1 MAG: helix-turn-helix transcriptional regulator [Fimbriimonadaceae bacterium]